MYTIPGSAISPSSASFTVITPVELNLAASNAVKSAGMCCTMKIGTLMGALKAPNTCISASGPPVETPIQTASAGFAKTPEVTLPIFEVNEDGALTGAMDFAAMGVFTAEIEAGFGASATWPSLALRVFTRFAKPIILGINSVSNTLKASSIPPVAFTGLPT